jgi:hypothetical protein
MSIFGALNTNTQAAAGQPQNNTFGAPQNNGQAAPTTSIFGAAAAPKPAGGSIFGSTPGIFTHLAFLA